jgi:hypothetical protein
VQFALGGDRMMKVSRTPEVYADAAYEVLVKPAQYTGRRSSSSRCCGMPASPTSRATPRRRGTRQRAVPGHLPLTGPRQRSWQRGVRRGRGARARRARRRPARPS